MVALVCVAWISLGDLGAALADADGLWRTVATLACLALSRFVLSLGRSHSKVPLDLDEYVARVAEERDTPGDIDAYENMFDVKSGGFSRVKMVRRSTTKEVYALKLTNIHKAFDEGQVNQTLNEKEILFDMDHPFIVKLYTTFRDTSYVYFLLEFVDGGELFDVVKEQGKLDLASARFFAANIIAAVEYIHDRDIAFRDIKFENLLVDKQGYLKLIDFGMARYVDKDRCHTFAGTLDYASPEILSNVPYTERIDWWALGCLIYEMLTGKTPFRGTHEERYRAMLKHAIPFDDPKLDPTAKDLIRQLLHPTYSKRLGTSEDGAWRIRCHPFFKDFDWKGLMRRELKAPKFEPRSPPALTLVTTKKIATKSLGLSVRKAVENDPPESPRVYSPKAIDTFFTGF